MKGRKTVFLSVSSHKQIKSSRIKSTNISVKQAGSLLDRFDWRCTDPILIYGSVLMLKKNSTSEIGDDVPDP